MSWTKLDDAMGEHRKTRRVLRSAGLDAFGLHVLGILHASRYLTDGHIERDFVEETFELARTTTKAGERSLAALCDQALWVPTDDGWVLHDYLDHNPSRERVLEQRRKDAERKARGRGADSNGSPNGVRADSKRTPAGVRGESGRPVPSRPTPTTPPSPPLGGRERDKVRYREELAEYVAPICGEYDAPPAIVAQVVEQAVKWGKAKTTEDVLAYCDAHPQLERTAA